jgi:hypothetical protein
MPLKGRRLQSEYQGMTVDDVRADIDIDMRNMMQDMK